MASQAANVQHERLICLRIIRADLLTNIELGGKMDPFVEIRSLPKGERGPRHKIAQTPTDWNGHLNPTWDYTSRGHPFEEGERLELRVMEDDMIGRPDLCGAGSISVTELFDDFSAAMEQVTSTGLEVHGPIKKVPIEKKHKNEGTVTVQAILVPGNFEEKDSFRPSRSQLMTRVPPDMFKTPVKRLGVSGGTAPFFKLELLDPPRGFEVSHYIGKDLSRAQDEIDFYEEVNKLKATADGKAEALLFSFMFEYAGVFQCTEDLEGMGGGEHDELMDIQASSSFAPAASTVSAGPRLIKAESTVKKKEDKALDLLVLRNLHDGCTKLRLLDVKIGQKTAQAGWQGKSRIAALRQSVIDGITTSSAQGFRLEGFNGEPRALSSMDPLLDFGGSGAGNTKAAKKAKRVMLQRMPASEMLMHMLDLTEAEVPQEALSHAEYGEIVLHEMVIRLLQLSMACRHSPVPQKWIGSSVALGFDCGVLPKRSASEDSIRRDVRVHIFDWGRSELNTLKKHTLLSESDRLDRAKFWSYYCGGIDRLTWEFTRAYLHRYGNAEGWGSLLMRVHDFDSQSSNDFIGQVYLEKLAPCSKTTASLSRKDNKKEISSTLTYSIEYISTPPNSRLAGVWRIHIHSASRLLSKDVLMCKTTSDPFVELIAYSKQKSFVLRQQTSVIVSTLDPVWDTHLDLPVARSTKAFDEALSDVREALSAEILTKNVLLPEEPKEINGKPLSDNDRDKAIGKWVRHMDSTSERVSLQRYSTIYMGRSTTDLEKQLVHELPDEGSHCAVFNIGCFDATSVAKEGSSKEEPLHIVHQSDPRPSSNVTEEETERPTYNYVPGREKEDTETSNQKEAAGCQCWCQ